MKVSVLVPVYNGEKTIKKTLESILEQTHKDLELLVIDNGSTDNSAEIIKSIKDPRIRYYKYKNSGSPSRPRNTAIKKATGDFIALCDHDDIWYKKKLETQLKAYRGAPSLERIGIIASSADLIDVDNNVIEKNILENRQIPAEEARSLLLHSNFITACSSMVPLSVMREAGDFNENLRGVDEYDVWLRITKKYDVLTISEALCAWKMTGDNMSGDKVGIYMQNEKIFDRLEKEENSSSVKSGHIKNLNRLLVASLLSRNSAASSVAIEKLAGKNIGLKVRLIITIAKINRELARVFIAFLRKIGVVNA